MVQTFKHRNESGNWTHTVHQDDYEALEAKLAEATAELDAARAEGFAQGIEAAAKVASGWLAAFQGVEIQRTSAREYACDAVMDIADGIRALSPTPQADRCAECDCQGGGDECTWISSRPQPDPVREAVTERMIDAAFNALPPDAHGTIGSGEMYRVIEAALAQKGE